MKIRTLVLATTLLSAATGFAFAQSSPAPANTSGPGVSATTPSPTESGAVSESGNTKGNPSRGTMNAHPGGATTTGSGMNAPAKDTMGKNKSPASTDAGVKQEK